MTAVARRRTRPTARLALGLAAAVPLLLLAPLEPRVVALVAGWDLLLLALGLVEAAWLGPRVRLRLEREVGPRLSVGAWNDVRLRLESLSPIALRLELGDRPPVEFDRDRGPGRVDLAPFARAEAAYRVRPHRRGRYRFGDVGIAVEGPAGLVRLVERVELAGEVRVYPDLGSLRRVALAARFHDLGLLGFHSLRREGAGDELDKLRPYQAGDDYRDVNWKATARTSRPVTQVYQTERSQRLLLAIDCGRSMAASAGELTKLDVAVNAALVLGQVALGTGDLVGLAVFSTEVRSLLVPGRGAGHFARLVEALYAVEEELSFVDFRALAREVLARRLRRALVAVFTDLLDEPSSRPLVDALRLLRRKHAVLVVAPSDPVVLEAARAGARGREDVFRSLAAREALGERRSVLEAVRRLGVEVVDAAAPAMAVAGVNRYLAMKRRRAI